VQAKVVSKITGNQFTIRTNRPNVEVSWQVTGIRNDLYAKAHPFEAEVAKSSVEKGKYLTPELYSQPKEFGIHYRPETQITYGQITSRD
jgi:trimeric autotransporter adhesin